VLERDCKTQVVSDPETSLRCYMEEHKGKTLLHPAERSGTGCREARVMGPRVWLKPTPLRGGEACGRVLSEATPAPQFLPGRL